MINLNGETPQLLPTWAALQLVLGLAYVLAGIVEGPPVGIVISGAGGIFLANFLRFTPWPKTWTLHRIMRTIYAGMGPVLLVTLILVVTAIFGRL